MKKKKLRVCAYARVSTEREEQEYSFKSQVDYYKKYISDQKDWAFAGIYADPGLSGKNLKRPDFQRMLQDCENGKIDRILTKSISRFARNMVDCIQSVRKLKSKNISVYFEKEGLDTMRPGTDFVLSVMASFAEEESRSISNNIKWAIRKKFANGQVIVSTAHFLGYTKDENKQMIVVPKQALVIRRIYEEYLDGASLEQIADRLTEDGILTPSSRVCWDGSVIFSILQNEKYKGDCFLQKTFLPDFLALRRVKNEGQLPGYYIKMHHAPIITDDIFNQVQAELKRRKNLANVKNVFGSKHSSKYAFSGKLVCQKCGAKFRRRMQKRFDGQAVFWICKNHDQNGNSACQVTALREDTIQRGFTITLRQIFYQKDEILKKLLRAIKSTVNDSCEDYLRNCDQMITKTLTAIESNKSELASGRITKEEFDERMRPLVYRESMINLQKEEILQEQERMLPANARVEKIEKALNEFYAQFFDTMFRAAITDVSVISNKFAVYRLINGSSYYVVMN